MQWLQRTLSLLLRQLALKRWKLAEQQLELFYATQQQALPRHSTHILVQMLQPTKLQQLALSYATQQQALPHHSIRILELPLAF